jgi:hypothetical protein
VLFDVGPAIHELAIAAGSIEFNPPMTIGLDPAMPDSPFTAKEVETVQASHVGGSLGGLLGIL